MTRYQPKHPGFKRKFNHDEIKRGFMLGLANETIAEVVGCTSGYVKELREKYERRKKRLCEGRVC